MKHSLILIPIILLAVSFAAAAQSADTDTETENPVVAFVPQSDKPYFVFNEGVAASWLTRIIKQTGRSNFVYHDFLAGLYFTTELRNIKYIVPVARVTAYYPLSATFNKIPQKPKSPLHFGIDFIAGVQFNLDILKYARFNLGPGLHLFFLNSDRWNYFDLGIAGLLGIELPLSAGWTILINGYASLDNGNLGTNRKMEPFDIAFQYQLDFGVRYSKRSRNTTALIPAKSFRQ
jgi:hypothetical protein